MQNHLGPRIFVNEALDSGLQINLNAAQSHYLQHVMRLNAGDQLRLFNGQDGEWDAMIASVTKKSVTLQIAQQLHIQAAEPDLWLCCAIIKKAHFEFMIEKATELGVAAIQPLLTARTQIREINLERCRSIAIEAAEQSERLSIPIIKPVLTLDGFVTQAPQDRRLIICAESGDAHPLHDAFQQKCESGEKAMILTGPEGGFTPEEFNRLRQIDNALFVRLGPLILRADTAAIAALGCWQAIKGDWRSEAGG